MAVFFNGRLWISPATMSVVDDSAMYNRNQSVGNVVALLGKADGGEPQTALRFGSPEEARDSLRSGDLLRAVEKSFDPSSETGGPAEVVAIRVNPAKQASRTLKDDGDKDAIELVSEGYGRYTNRIKIKIENGSVNGKKVTTQFGSSYYTQDNVGRLAFDVKYEGSESAGKLTVTPNKVTLQAGVDTTDIDLADYDTIGAVVDHINTLDGFVANVLDNNGEKPSRLDSVAEQDIKTNKYEVRADLQAIVDWINGQGEGYVTATLATGAENPPANIPFKFLSDGSDGEVTNEEWQKAFDALQTEDVQWVTPVSPDPSIHAMADTHVDYMSNVARMERRCIVGTDVGTDDDDAIEAAKNLNNDRTSLTHLGYYDYDEKGSLTLYPAYFMAALLAGMFSGVNPGTPLTNKSIKVSGLERNLRNPTDTDRLIKGGVLCVENTPAGYKVVKSISTWLTNDNYNRVEISTGVATDFVSREVRESLDPLRGKKGSPRILAQAISRADTKLQELARPEPSGPGIIVGDEKNPPYKDIRASMEGDVLRVEFQASPVIPVNYISITVHAVPYSGSAAA